MVVIQPEQLAQISTALQERYYAELRRALRERSPAMVASFTDAALRDIIATAVERAGALKIRSGGGILAYVGLAIAAGPEFYELPKTRSYLESPRGDPDEKMEWLFKRVLEKLKEMANG